MIIYMKSVRGKPTHRALCSPLAYKKVNGSIGAIPAGFEWDGSSVPLPFQGIFPRHRHPVASCRHDWRCKHAKNDEDRLWADKEFKKDVGVTSWLITEWIGYGGVRVGAFFGIGSNFK